jgi:regulator of ribonuclease activity A
MDLSTADLCDRYPDRIGVAEPLLRSFGGAERFAGTIATVRVLEDNVLVARAIDEPGEGRVLVVEGGGSTRCALLGDRLAGLARDHGWSGIVVNGCVRDVAVLRTMELGVLALAACPRKSGKRGEGERDVPVSFAGLRFEPGHHLVADADGLIVADGPLG